MVKRLLTTMGLALGLMCQPLFAQNDAQNLSAFVDRNEVTLNEIITLTIRVDNSLGNSRPSLSGLNRDFEQIGNVSTRSSYTNINGTVQSFVDYIVRLRPLSTGALTIPAFRINNEATAPIRINVGEADQVTNAVDSEIFIESTVSKEQIYVQEQLLYTIKLYYSISFDQGAQLTSPQVADAVVQQLGSDETYSEIVSGIRYNVTERKFVIFPQSSGQLTIPPVYFTATVGRRGGLTRFFNNRTSVREINLASDIHAIDVQGKPASFPGQTWLPAANISIEESWSGSVENLAIGDSVTRNIRLTASGLSSSLLPGIIYKDMDGLKFYSDQPTREDSANDVGITGSRSEGTAIVPSEAGEFVIPEVVVPWWNTTTDTLERAVIPARTLSVVPGTAAAQSVAPDLINLNRNVPTGNNGPLTMAPQTSGLYLFWITATAVFAVAWLFSTTMWMRNRRLLAFLSTATPAMMPRKSETTRAPASLNADSALKVLRTALSEGSGSDIKRCLIAWGKALYRDDTLLTLSQLIQQSNDTELAGLLAKLEKSLYSVDTADALDRNSLELVVNRIHRLERSNRKTGNNYSLPPLYKN
jgi:hypothetical protein